MAETLKTLEEVEEGPPEGMQEETAAPSTEAAEAAAGGQEAQDQAAHQSTKVTPEEMEAHLLPVVWEEPGELRVLLLLQEEQGHRELWGAEEVVEEALTGATPPVLVGLEVAVAMEMNILSLRAERRALEAAEVGAEDKTTAPLQQPVQEGPEDFTGPVEAEGATRTPQVLLETAEAAPKAY